MPTNNLTKDVKKPKIHWGFWLGVSFFVGVILTVLSSSWYLTEKMVMTENMPISSLNITGEIHYTKHSEIVRALEEINLSNFFQVDVNKVQQKIAELPWVYSVSVRKQWPDELKIYLVDQTPVALWNGDFLINSYGDVFEADLTRLTADIPHFFGPEGSETIALENFSNFNKLLNFAELSIDELVLSERFSWQLTLSDGVLLNLGRENRFERISRFMDLYSQMKLRHKNNQQVNYVDLRYDTGAAVGWKPVIKTKPLAKQSIHHNSKALKKEEHNRNV